MLTRFLSTIVKVISLLTIIYPVYGECTASKPKDYGIVLLRAFDGMDINGPVDALQILAHFQQLNLYLIADTLDPVTSEPAAAAMNPYNSSFWPEIMPTHTFETAPDLDVLILPGGPSVRAPNLNSTYDFVAQRYSSLRYLITICTGAGLAAKAGVLDGKRATTNKSAWATITAMGPNVKWVSPARWVVDGNIWTSSGVTAGLDLIFEYIKVVYSQEDADKIAGMMEYERHTDPSWDPFAAYFNVTPTGN